MSLAIVTGSNRGIGLSLVERLALRGARVLAACRETSSALDALAAERPGQVEVTEGIDVTDDASVDALHRAVRHRTVDLLVNNAGILVGGDDVDSPNVEGMRRQFEVNALGPLRVTLALRRQLTRGSKVALITSRMGSLEDNHSGGHYGYRMSKAALNMAGRSLANDLREAGVTVLLLHPGMVKTAMVGDHGDVEPATAAQGLLERIDALGIDETGSFWHANGQRLPF